MTFSSAHDVKGLAQVDDQDEAVSPGDQRIDDINPEQFTGQGADPTTVLEPEPKPKPELEPKPLSDNWIKL
jgi:hypothetical protein